MKIEAETFAGAAGLNMEEGRLQEPRNINNAALDAEKAKSGILSQSPGGGVVLPTPWLWSSETHFRLLTSEP